MQINKKLSNPNLDFDKTFYKAFSAPVYTKRTLEPFGFRVLFV